MKMNHKIATELVEKVVNRVATGVASEAGLYHRRSIWTLKSSPVFLGQKLWRQYEHKREINRFSS